MTPTATASEVLPGVFAFAGALIALQVLFFLVGLASFIFWIVMVVHAVRHDIKDKALWIIVLLIGYLLGAVIYYFAVKRKYGKAPAPAAPVAPPSSPPPTAPPAPPAV